MSLFLLAFQALAATQPDAAAIGGLDDFDLAKVRPADPQCGQKGGRGDIVVCGKKAMDVVFAHPRDYSEKPVRTRVALPGGGTIDAHVEEKEMPGARATRAMVTLKLSF